jgi:hypothetical protein
LLRLLGHRLYLALKPPPDLVPVPTRSPKTRSPAVGKNIGQM